SRGVSRHTTPSTRPPGIRAIEPKPSALMTKRQPGSAARPIASAPLQRAAMSRRLMFDPYAKCSIASVRLAQMPPCTTPGDPQFDTRDSGEKAAKAGQFRGTQLRLLCLMIGEEFSSVQLATSEFPRRNDHDRHSYNRGPRGRDRRDPIFLERGNARPG